MDETIDYMMRGFFEDFDNCLADVDRWELEDLQEWSEDIERMRGVAKDAKAAITFQTKTHDFEYALLAVIEEVEARLSIIHKTVNDAAGRIEEQDEEDREYGSYAEQVRSTYYGSR